MSDNNPKNWDDERLIKLLDSALSSHAYMKEELDKTEWKLAEIVEKLLDKYHDQYEDWRTMFRNRYILLMFILFRTKTVL